MGHPLGESPWGFPRGTPHGDSLGILPDNSHGVPHDDSAWASTSEGDQKLIKAMKAGSTMVVVGYSSRDTKTTDTYSLSGFTAAYNAISKACSVKPVN